MGYYLETPARNDKTGQLRELHGAQDVDPDSLAWPPPEGKALVCVVQNGLFDAAAVCYDEAEYRVFNDPTDPRRTDWLLLDADWVRDMTGAPV